MNFSAICCILSIEEIPFGCLWVFVDKHSTISGFLLLFFHREQCYTNIVKLHYVNFQQHLFGYSLAKPNSVADNWDTRPNESKRHIRRRCEFDTFVANLESSKKSSFIGIWSESVGLAEDLLNFTTFVDKIYNRKFLICPFYIFTRIICIVKNAAKMTMKIQNSPTGIFSPILWKIKRLIRIINNAQTLRNPHQPWLYIPFA